MRVWEAVTFAGGWVALAVALVSPLHPWGGALFSAHMTAVRARLLHDDPGALLRYSLDGGAPDETSPAYTGPLELTGPATVRARAFRPGHTPSVAVHETFIVDE